MFGKSTGTFVLGKKDGNWLFYDHKGKKIRSENWDNGTLIDYKEF
jgi:antitoxin component YwqK of YwqJK toxin-antitoxin module